MMPPASTLTDTDVAMIRTIMREEISKHQCRFDVAPDVIPQVGHMFGMVTDLGKGSLREGIEVLRDNHKAMVTLRGKISQLATAIGMAVILAITSGVVAACWIGVKVLAVAKGVSNGQ